MRGPEERATERMSGFEMWLRTGRIDAIERKFNPWHDPRDGRFTFRNGQTWTGGGFTGGGGGSTGGGGASGRWRTPAPMHRTRPVAAETPGEMRRIVSVGDPGKTSDKVAQTTVAKHINVPAAAPASGEHKPWRHVEANGYDYAMDEKHRTREVTGDIFLDTEQGRSKPSQAQAGGPGRPPDDHGGHHIARRFGDPKEAFNHFAQNGKVNLGEYRRLENTWTKAKREGMSVHVDIVPHYSGTSLRPYGLSVSYVVDGHPHKTFISNLRRGGKHGR